MMQEAFAIPLWQNVLQLLGVLIVFILILIVTYYTTKWIGKSGLVQTQSQNISVIETFKIAPNKYIQIIKLGTKYYAIGVSKENIEFLTELEEEQLSFTEAGQVNPVSFKDIMDKVLPKHKNKFTK